MTGEKHSPNHTRERQRSKSLTAVSTEQYVNSAFSGDDDKPFGRSSNNVFTHVDLSTSAAVSSQNLSKSNTEMNSSVIKIHQDHPSNDPSSSFDDAKIFSNSSCAHSRLSLISEIFTKTSWRERNAGWLTILCQMGLPFLIAGLGMVMAGVLLENAMV